MAKNAAADAIIAVAASLIAARHLEWSGRCGAPPSPQIAFSQRGKGRRRRSNGGAGRRVGAARSLRPIERMVVFSWKGEEIESVRTSHLRIAMHAG